jgi:hypothetical protein
MERFFECKARASFLARGAEAALMIRVLNYLRQARFALSGDVYEGIVASAAEKFNGASVEGQIVILKGWSRITCTNEVVSCDHEKMNFSPTF